MFLPLNHWDSQKVETQTWRNGCITVFQSRSHCESKLSQTNFPNPVLVFIYSNGEVVMVSSWGQTGKEQQDHHTRTLWIQTKLSDFLFLSSFPELGTRDTENIIFFGTKHFGLTAWNLGQKLRTPLFLESLDPLTVLRRYLGKVILSSAWFHSPFASTRGLSFITRDVNQTTTEPQELRGGSRNKNIWA